MNKTEEFIFSVLAASPALRKAKKPAKIAKKKIPVKKTDKKVKNTKNKGETKAEKKVEGVKPKKPRPKHHKPKEPPKKEDKKRQSLFIKPKPNKKKSLFKTADKIREDNLEGKKKEKAKLGRPEGPKKGSFFDRKYGLNKNQDKEDLLTREEIEQLSNRIQKYMVKKNVQANHKVIMNNFKNQLQAMMRQYK